MYNWIHLVYFRLCGAGRQDNICDFGLDFPHPQVPTDKVYSERKECAPANKNRGKVSLTELTPLHENQ